MTPEDVKLAVETAIGAKVLLTWTQIALIILVTALACYFAGYFGQKGKNLATQEDVRELTRRVEEIKVTYTKQIEDYKTELSRREQSKRIAELLAMAHYGNPKDNKVDFTHLAWELSISLPPSIVCQLTEHLVALNKARIDPKDILIAVRKLLHGQQDELKPEQIIHLNC